MAFYHLHLHTEYSLNDSSIRAKELAKKLKSLGMKKCAVTDHGVMFNIPAIYKALEYEGIELIVGMETYVAPRINTMKEAKIDNANYHLVLLAENETGYKNLIKLASDAAIEGFYYRARTDKVKLKQHSEGIIALSACLGGEVQKALMNSSYEEAKKIALEYNEIFGQDNFYLELQDHGIPEQGKVNPLLIRMSKETGIPLVATNDCHYVEKEDWEAHDILMAIQAKTTITDTKRKVYSSHEFYIKSEEEMREIFHYCQEAIDNTVKIGDRCNFKFEFGGNLIPEFELPPSFSGSGTDFLRKLSYEGAAELYGEITPEIEERIEYELSVIDNMGFIDYFLITWDFFRFCKYGTDNIEDDPIKNWEPILTGPGRGSGAGSIILYTTGVTKIDPLKYNLLFERFLDPSRISLPDVDSDFQDSRRQEVIDYTIRKYGKESVCQIITFGTMAARAAIRAVGRALDYNYAVYDKAAKMIPATPGITIKEALAENKDLATLYEKDKEVKTLIDFALRLEGLPTSTSTHAAGVLIVDKRGVTSHVPMWKNDSGIVAQYDKDLLEDLGLIKMDFLGLKTLGVLGESKYFAERNHGIKINFDDIYNLPTMEPLKLIKEGKTMGIFQLEGPGMTGFMKELAPDCIDDVIAGISLYRPGPMKEIPRFLHNKRNPQDIVYPFKEIEDILSETYGVLTYQEQCMRAVVNVAGYDKSDSDGFRKVMAKKKIKLLPLHKKWFTVGRKSRDLDENGRKIDYPHAIPGGLSKGHVLKELENFFELMEDFGKYAFNKSHAAAYAFLAYCTAWFAYFYPVEFMAALLNSVKGNRTKVAKYMRYCKKTLGIEIIEPNINISTDKFEPLKNGEIVYALAVKNTKASTLKEIILEREANGIYEDITDFIVRTRGFLDKATFESLIICGAFNTFGLTKSRWIAALEDIWDSALKKTKDAEKRAIKSNREFDFRARFLEKIEGILPDISEYPEEIALKMEKDVIGLYLTGNPLFKYAYSIKTLSDFDMSQLEYEIDEDSGIVNMLDDSVRDGQRVRFIAMVNEIREFTTKKKKDLMASAELEDLSGFGEAVIWARNYETLRDKLKEDSIYLVHGRLKITLDDRPIISIENIESVDEILTERVIIESDDRNVAKSLLEFISKDKLLRGSSPTYVTHNNMRILLSKEFWVNKEHLENYKDEFKFKIQTW